MKFLIPDQNLPLLKKRIERLQKKTDSVKFEILEPDFIILPNEVAYKAHWVEASGEYRINGWRYVATIEHHEFSNLIFGNKEGLEIPSRFWESEPVCEHCGINRQRKTTVLLINEKGEFKQVGTSCLLAYCGMSAEVVACIESCFHLAKEPTDFEFWQTNCQPYGHDCKDVQKVCFAIIRKYGYAKMDERHPTKILVSNTYGGDKSIISDAEVDAIGDDFLEGFKEWAFSQNDSDYINNVRQSITALAVDESAYGIIASACNLYLNYLERQKRIALGTSEHVGKDGERIEIDVQSFRVLYTKHYDIGYYGKTVYVYRIIDWNGNVYKWNASDCFCINGDVLPEQEFDRKGRFVIKATVKAHDEYKGEKQTIITRAKYSDQIEWEE